MKDIKSERDLGARARKRREIKQLESQENESENENEKKSERDQRVVHRTVSRQVRVGVVALVIKRRRKMFSENVDLVAEAMKGGQRKRDLTVKKETKIMTKIVTEIEKDDQEAAIDLVLLVHDQKVKVQIRSKRNPKAAETRENEMKVTAQIGPRKARNPRSQRKMRRVQVSMKNLRRMTRMRNKND